jgi:hypothetical protein
VFAAVERLHDVSADSLRKSAGKAKGTGAPLVFSLSRGPNKPPFKVRASASVILFSRLMVYMLMYIALGALRTSGCSSSSSAAARQQASAMLVRTHSSGSWGPSGTLNPLNHARRWTLNG